jgi:hypothetical protein
MSYSKSAFVTIIPPSGQSFEANIDYGEQRDGEIEGTIVPGNIVSSLGMFLGRRHTLVSKNGDEYEIEILSDPKWGFRSVHRE